MARDVGDTILQAAQGIVQQNQSAQSLQLKATQLGEQIKNANNNLALQAENLRLREESLKIQQENAKAFQAQVETQQAAAAQRDEPLDPELVQSMLGAITAEEPQARREAVAALGKFPLTANVASTLSRTYNVLAGLMQANAEAAASPDALKATAGSVRLVSQAITRDAGTLGLNRFASTARNVRAGQTTSPDPRVAEYNRLFASTGSQFNSVEAVDKQIERLEIRVGALTEQRRTPGANVRGIDKSINDLSNRQTQLQSMRAILESVRSESASDFQLRSMAAVAVPGPLRQAIDSALASSAEEHQHMQVFLKPAAQLRTNSLDNTTRLFRDLASFPPDSEAHKAALDMLVADMVPLSINRDLFAAQQGSLLQFMQQEVDVDGQPITAGKMRDILIEIRNEQAKRAAAMKQSVDPQASQRRGAASILGASSEAALNTTTERARRRGR
jgi:hypothetical protein